jgi:ribosomal protein S21
MKHRRDNGTGKVARIRVSFDMLPKAIQRAGRDKQLEVMKKMFKRACDKYGIFPEMKEREHYIKPGEKKRKAERLKRAVARGEITDSYKDREETKSFDEFNF